MKKQANKFLVIVTLGFFTLSYWGWCIDRQSPDRPDRDGNAGIPGPVLPNDPEEDPDSDEVKNIILMIGDGMGVSQVTGAMYRNNNTLQMERFKHMGLHKTHSSDKLITDSAAGATAFSCGFKTFNGALGKRANGSDCKTILERMKEDGYAVGLVATSSITHATPAAFIAHVDSRSKKEEIAAFFQGSGIDYFAGGGMSHFNERKTDSRNLIKELEDEGYVIKSFADGSLESITPDPSKPYGYFQARNHPREVPRRGNYLVNATHQALHFLKQRSSKGFFIMIEGSQIDWAGHDNNGPWSAIETIDFDKAIGTALDFADNNPGTLVIVTADHETGGLAIHDKSQGGNLYEKASYQYTTDYHTAAMVPVFAYGPKANLFGGIYENIAIYNKMLEALLGGFYQ